MIPFGKAKVVREGKNLSIITYGALVQRSIVAAKQAEQEGISVEIVDLRSLVPYDWNAIVATVKKTNRVIVAHEDALSFGYGAEVAARISSELFEHLDAPVRRVCALDTFVAYAPQLEDVILPQVTDRLASSADPIRCNTVVYCSVSRYFRSVTQTSPKKLSSSFPRTVIRLQSPFE